MNCLYNQFHNKASVYNLLHLQNLDTWTAPPKGSHKINCDGSLDIHSSSGGIGVVARDSNGLVSAVRASFLLKCHNMLYLKSLARLAGMYLAEDLKLDNVIFEVDNNHLVNILERNGPLKMGKSRYKTRMFFDREQKKSYQIIFYS